MSTKVLIDRATPRIPGKTTTPEDMVDTGTTAIAGILSSPSIGTAPAVSAAATAWQTVNTSLAANNASKATGRSMVEVALANEPPLQRRWLARKQGVENAIAIFADGSKQVAQSFTVMVEQKVAPPEATVPQNLRPMKKQQATYASVRWNPTPGAHGYLMQHATNTSDPTTYSVPLNLTQSKYHLSGQTPGVTVYFRVLALDTRLAGGQTAYTAWVAVVVPG
jgi:hypothetical protein